MVAHREKCWIIGRVLALQQKGPWSSPLQGRFWVIYTTCKLRQLASVNKSSSRFYLNTQVLRLYCTVVLTESESWIPLLFCNSKLNSS